MDVLTPEHAERIKSVKSALQLFGERSQGEGYVYKNSSPFSIPEDVANRARDIQSTRKDNSKMSESESNGENEIARLRSELYDARKVAEALASRIKESKSRASTRKKEIGALNVQKFDKGVLISVNGESGIDHQYEEVVKELELKKRQLSKLKLDVGSAVSEKLKAEEETRAAHSKRRSNLKSIEKLGKEIDEADEESVLAELARIEAIKEAKELEVQREAEAARYTQKLQEARARIAELKKEVSHAKKLEQKLAVTTSDLDVLQSEMMLVRAMEKKSDTEVEPENAQLLQAARMELEAAKKELDSIKEEGFKYMASMDAVRQKMSRISSDASRLRKSQEMTDARVKDLNAKLLRAHYELESISNSERMAKAAASDLSVALSNLQSEKDKARKEEEQAVKETENLKAEIWKNDSVIDAVKDALLSAAQELELVKCSGAAAFAKLQTLSEKAMKSRAAASRRRSTITISNSEYEYLKSGAIRAREVANKKTDAALAWVEAFKASEKELVLQTEWIQMEMKEMGDIDNIPQPPEPENESASETKEKRRRSQVDRESPALKSQEKTNTPRKSMREGGTISNSRRSSLHRRPLISNGSTPSRAPSISLRRRRKVMRKLAKILGGTRVLAHD